ncbi:MAG: hypothetical protein BWY68_00018 [bacterium ADurb.Bin400]|nr:MAG: hypothetical protein BWY68_00018 [bacterium ADurb.Bin400]
MGGYERIIATPTEIVDVAREVAGEVNQLKVLLEQKKREAREGVDKINRTIVDVNELIRVVSEILAGRAIPSTDTLTISQIRVNSWGDANTAGSPANGESNKKRISPRLIFELLTGKIDVATFFYMVGAGIVESEVGLPANSLVYYVENVERRGIIGLDAFYISIGQAKIEMELGMPSFYFQGKVLESKMPKFSQDYEAVRRTLTMANDQDRYKDYLGVYFSFYALAYITNIRPAELPGALSKAKKDNPAIFNQIVQGTEMLWKDERKDELARRGGKTFGDIDLDDLFENMVARNYARNAADAGRILLTKMGIPGNVDGLRSGSTVAWAAGANEKARALDNKLDIPLGSTRQFLTDGMSVPGASGEFDITNDDKNKLNAGLKISKEALGQYIQLLNHELSMADLQALGLTSDYNSTNPYAVAPEGINGACPITFELIEPGAANGKGRFMVNRTSLEPNTYSYYDKRGRHTFKSLNEAQRYANEHAEDRINAIEMIAQSLSKAYGPLLHGDFDNPELVANRIRRFADAQTNNIFTEQEWRTLSAADMEGLEQAGEDIHPALVSLELLSSLFSRRSVNKPLEHYKKAIGKVEATKIASWRLFGLSGINIDPTMFGPENLFEILNGDFHSLFPIGATFIDRELGLPKGTSFLIWNARSEATRSCALSQAGMSIFGDLFGLQAIETSGNLIQNIGQAKVEESLRLPRGTFYGESIEQLMMQIKPINFVLAFKIPVAKSVISNTNSILLDSVGSGKTRIQAIMGPNYHYNPASFDTRYHLARIRDYVTTTPIMTDEANAAVHDLDVELVQQTLRLMQDYPRFSMPPGGDASDLDKQFFREIKEFNTFLTMMDGMFNLPTDSSYNLMVGNKTPNSYTIEIGTKMVTRKALQELFELFGLSDDKAEAATNLLTEFNRVTTCSRFDMNGHCTDDMYHNWAYVYQNVSKLFSLNLDDKAGLEQGTIHRILSNPEDAHLILGEQAAKKLDARFRRDPNTLMSFTALYKRIASAIERRNDQSAELERQCIASVYPNGENVELNRAYESNLAVLYEPAVTQREGESDTDFARRRDDQEGRWEQARNNLGTLSEQIHNGNQRTSDCKASRRNAVMGTRPGSGLGTVIDATVDWAMDVMSEQISNYIRDVEIDGQRVGVNMPVADVREMVFGGDLRYLEAVGVAMAANYVYVVIDGTGSDRPIPPAMRISYEDIKYSLFGHPGADAAAVDAATWGFMHPENGGSAPDPRIGYSFGNVCTGSNGYAVGTLQCMTTGDYVAGGNPMRSGTNLVAANTSTTQAQYHVDPTSADWNPQTLSDFRTEVHGAPAYWENEADNAWFMAETAATPEEAEMWEDYAWECEESAASARSRSDDLRRREDDAKEQSRKIFRETLQYRLLDAMLWKMDENIFPGFAQAMLKGDAATKQLALAAYLHNGLLRGRIGPITFDAVPPEILGTVLTVAAFAQGNLTLDQFMASPGYGLLRDYVSRNSRDWFGVSLNPEFIEGIFTGIATGDWGFSLGVDGDSLTHTHTLGSGQQVQTIGSAVMNWAQNKIFAWADKKLGLPPGTSFQAFNLAVGAYKAIRFANEMRNLNNLAQAWKTASEAASFVNGAAAAGGSAFSGPVGQGYLASVNQQAAEARDAFQTALGNSSQRAQEAIQQSGGSATADAAAGSATKAAGPAIDASTKAQISLYSFLITTAIGKLFGKQIAQAEEALGLVPGTGMILVGLAVEAGVTYLLTNGGAFFANPATAYIAIGMFIVMNLFGYYKIEYKCSADGYYPVAESPPSPTVTDVAGLGVWNGKSSEEMQVNSKRAAQYKARRLLIDMLEIQNSPRFSDPKAPLMPTQIMTGRQEDVAALLPRISSDLCFKRYGMEADTKGVCGGSGETRSGIWSNPQTIGWTHIGF